MCVGPREVKGASVSSPRAVVPVSRLVQDLQHDEAGAGGDAAPLAARVIAVSGNDPRDVRSVAVVVVRCEQIAHEVDEVDDRAVPEVVVPVGDPRVDDRDAYAGAVEPEPLVHPPGADSRRRAFGRAFDRSGDRAIERDGEHFGA